MRSLLGQRSRQPILGIPPVSWLRPSLVALDELLIRIQRSLAHFHRRGALRLQVRQLLLQQWIWANANEGLREDHIDLDSRADAQRLRVQESCFRWICQYEAHHFYLPVWRMESQILAGVFLQIQRANHAWGQWLPTGQWEADRYGNWGGEWPERATASNLDSLIEADLIATWAE